MQQRFAFACKARRAIGHDTFALSCSNLSTEVGLAGFAELAFAAFGGTGPALAKMEGKARCARTYYSATTLSPGFTFVTPSPTDSTTPAPSWPSTMGKAPSGSLPESVYASVLH